MVKQKEYSDEALAIANGVSNNLNKTRGYQDTSECMYSEYQLSATETHPDRKGAKTTIYLTLYVQDDNEVTLAIEEHVELPDCSQCKRGHDPFYMPIDNVSVQATETDQDGSIKLDDDAIHTLAVFVDAWVENLDNQE